MRQGMKMTTGPPRASKTKPQPKTEPPVDLSHNICLEQGYYIRPEDVDTKPIPCLVWQSANVRQDVLSIIKIELVLPDSQHFKDHEQLLQQCDKPEAHLYTVKWISMGGEEDIKSVFPMCVHSKNRASVPNLARVEFFDTDGAWKDLAEWLGEQTETIVGVWEYIDPKGEAREALRLQQVQQWDNNGMFFDLFGVPAEIRENIYHYALGPVIFPRLDRGAGPLPCPPKFQKTPPYHDFFLEGWALFLGIGVHTKEEDQLTDYVFAHPTDKTVDSPNINLLRTCKQVHNEALSVAWECSTVRVRGYDELEYRSVIVGPNQPYYLTQYEDNFTVADSLTMPALYVLMDAMSEYKVFKTMRHLQLELTIAAFYELAGIMPEAGDIGAPVPDDLLNLEDLESFEGLESIEFRFMHPREHFRSFKEQLGGFPSCHMKLCDGFLLFAHERMCPLLKTKKVTLSGYVRKETLEKRMPIYADEKKGIEHDMSKQAEAFRFKYSHNGVPACTCSPPCHVNEVIVKRHNMQWLAGYDIHLNYEDVPKEEQKYSSMMSLYTGKKCYKSHEVSPQLHTSSPLPKIFSEEREEIEGL